MINRDTTTYINTGEFFDKHPDIIGNVSKFERRSIDGTLEEAWERNEAGIMVDVTEKYRLMEEVAKAEKEVAKYGEEDSDT